MAGSRGPSVRDREALAPVPRGLPRWRACAVAGCGLSSEVLPRLDLGTGLLSPDASRTVAAIVMTSGQMGFSAPTKHRQAPEEGSKCQVPMRWIGSPLQEKSPLSRVPFDALARSVSRWGAPLRTSTAPPATHIRSAARSVGPDLDPFEDPRSASWKNPGHRRGVRRCAIPKSGLDLDCRRPATSRGSSNGGSVIAQNFLRCRLLRFAIP